MKNLIKNWWTSEVNRFNRHPIFWTVYTVLVIVINVLELRAHKSLMKELDETPLTFEE